MGVFSFESGDMLNWSKVDDTIHKRPDTLVVSVCSSPNGSGKNSMDGRLYNLYDEKNGNLKALREQEGEIPVGEARLVALPFTSKKTYYETCETIKYIVFVVVPQVDEEVVEYGLKKAYKSAFDIIARTEGATLALVPLLGTGNHGYSIDDSYEAAYQGFGESYFSFINCEKKVILVEGDSRGLKNYKKDFSSQCIEDIKEKKEHYLSLNKGKSVARLEKELVDKYGCCNDECIFFVMASNEIISQEWGEKKCGFDRELSEEDFTELVDECEEIGELQDVFDATINNREHVVNKWITSNRHLDEELGFSIGTIEKCLLGKRKASRKVIILLGLYYRMDIPSINGCLKYAGKVTLMGNVEKYPEDCDVLRYIWHSMDEGIDYFPWIMNRMRKSKEFTREIER